MPTKRLTDLFIEKLKAPKSGRVEYFDAAMSGLALRVTESGHKSWCLFYRHNGRLRRHTLGDFKKLNKVRAAHDAARAAFQQLVGGVDPGEAKRAARSIPTDRPPTVAEAAEAWLNEGAGPKKKPWRPKTAKEWRRIMEVDVLPKLGNRPVKSITGGDVAALIDKIAARAPVQANRVHTRLQRFFAWAAKRRYVEASPIADTEKPTHERSSERALSPRELAHCWRACAEVGPPFRDVFRLLALTAQRREQVRTMEWSEIDFERHRWEIPALKMKGDKSHIVHLSDAAIDILRSISRVDGSPYVFPATRRVVRRGKEPPGDHAAVSGFSRAKRRLDEEMEKLERKSRALPEGDDELRKKLKLKDGDDLPRYVPEWDLHDFRRTFATTAAEELKIAPHVVDKVLAHSAGAIRGVAAIYNRAEFLDERAAALDAWARYVAALVDGAPRIAG
jgi:integrase